MKKCDTCIYRNEDEYHKPCIVYRDDCEFYEKERGDMTDDLISRQSTLKPYEGLKDDDVIAVWLIRKNIEQQLSVNPQEPKTIQEKQAESEKYEKAYDDGYKNGYAQARFDYEQEPKTGHWIDDEIGSKCSCCGIHIDRFMKLNYCPNCGARMEERNIHCNHTDTEIAKSFIEDVEAVKDLLPQESEEQEA